MRYRNQPRSLTCMHRLYHRRMFRPCRSFGSTMSTTLTVVAFIKDHLAKFRLIVCRTGKR